MTQADLRSDRRTRWAAAGLALVLQVALVVGLIRAFAPQFVSGLASHVTHAFTLTASPTPTPSPTPAQAGAAAPAGRKATPRDSVAPSARIVVNQTEGPPVAAHGQDNTSGASQEGNGTGASGTGAGTGAGRGGQGPDGDGTATPTVKIAGDINSARDYPRHGRDLRVGASVTIDLQVGTDGRVTGCRVVAPSPDAEADRITCDLATKRFRFRPALDAAGNPRDALYRWRQRWFY